MAKKPLAALALLLIAGAAPAIQVVVLDYYDHVALLESQLALDLSLPEGGLAAYWPEEVEDVADLAPFVATIKDPARLNATLGEGAQLARGDFVVLHAVNIAGGYGFGGALFARGAAWTDPELTIQVTPLDYFGALDKAGVDVAFESAIGPHRDGLLFVGTVTDPAAFAAAFSGEGEVTNGQTVILRAGENGTRAWCTIRHDNLSPITIQIVDGIVKVLTK